MTELERYICIKNMEEFLNLVDKITGDYCFGRGCSDCLLKDSNGECHRCTPTTEQFLAVEEIYNKQHKKGRKS